MVAVQILPLLLQSAEGASTGALTPDSAFKLLSVLLALPHGVEKWSHAVDGEATANRLLCCDMVEMHSA